MKLSKKERRRRQKNASEAPSVMSLFHFDSSDRAIDNISGRMTPQRIAEILSIAAQGEPMEQTLLAEEITEKNPDIAHAIQTRRNAVTACDWNIRCDDTSALAGFAIEAATKQLQNAGFDTLIRACTGAIVPGYALAEIYWGPGGTIEGFKKLPASAITFQNTDIPHLRLTGEPRPIPIPEGKVIFHAMPVSDDLTRGGLIRPLAWLHCFSNVNMKDMLGFIERYAMPVILAQVSPSTSDTEVANLRRALMHFGNAGGGVLTQNTQLTTIQASTAPGTIYLEILKYLGDLMTKVILGQTATSGDASGWSKGAAQAQVRQDILDSDARMIEATINTQLLAHWQGYNFPQLDEPLTLEILSAPPEDEAAKWLAVKEYADAVGVAGRAGVLTPSKEIEAKVREKLGLPPMSDDVLKDWAKTGGTRSPITLAREQADADAVAAQNAGRPMYFNDRPKKTLPAASASRSVADDLADEATAEMIETGVLDQWLTPAAEHIAKMADADDQTFEHFLRNPQIPFGDASGVRDIIERETVQGIMEGVNEADRRRAKGGEK